jgi:hypothetical protein
VTTDFPADRVRFEEGVPVAVGDQPLGVATQLIHTREGGVWAVYGIGEEALVVHPGGAMLGPPAEVSRWLASAVVDDHRDRDDRRAAATLLELVGATDDAGSGAVPEPYGEREDVPRSIHETGLPPTYSISGPANRPGEPAPEAEPPPPRPRP